MILYDLIAKPLLFSFDAERAHGLSIAALKANLPLCTTKTISPRLNVNLAGIEFPNPLGIAAGYDKNAEVPDALLNLGFGFVECGTITPLPQSGNPKPRIFRLVEDEGVINRLGFNNEGLAAALARVKLRNSANGVLGINVGANKDTEDRIADYELGIKTFAPYASYLTVNISSPNTVGLRALQERESLAELLSRVMQVRNNEALTTGKRPPVFLKIAPDLTQQGLEDIVAEVLDKNVDGLIVSNTTLSRDGLRSRNASEAGGMSGKPLFDRSTSVLAKTRKLAGPDLPLIGVGGVNSAETALEKIRAGADLVQLYSSMIFGGPSMPAQIVTEMDRKLASQGIDSVTELRDSRMDHWAGRLTL